MEYLEKISKFMECLEKEDQTEFMDCFFFFKSKFMECKKKVQICGMSLKRNLNFEECP